MNSQVNHPTHYNQGKFEVIEVIEDQKLGFHLGNAIKYVCRAGKKFSGVSLIGSTETIEQAKKEKTIEDLEKAIWYIRRHIETLKEPHEVRRPNDMNPRS